MTDKTNQSLNPSLFILETVGLEPMTSWMPFRRSPNWAMPPRFHKGYYNTRNGIGKVLFPKVLSGLRAFSRYMNSPWDIWTQGRRSSTHPVYPWHSDWQFINASGIYLTFRSIIHQRIRYILDIQIDNSSTHPVYPWHSGRQHILMLHWPFFICEKFRYVLQIDRFYAKISALSQK